MTRGPASASVAFAMTLTLAASASLSFGIGAAAGGECIVPGWSIGERVCEGPDGWNLEIRGQALLTHGPDPAAPSALPPGGDLCLDSGAGDQIPYAYHCEQVPPTCVEGDAGEHYLVAIYARPSDVPDRFATMAPQIRDSIHGMNGIIHHEASLFNVTANLFALCQDDEIVVHNETLTTTAADDDNIVSELSDRGYNASNEKYVIFYDDAIPGLAGFAAGLNQNDSASASNPQNGVAYAVMAKTLDPVVFAHEYGHAMGAVKRSAPHNLGAHCSDGQDVMCYGPLTPSGPHTIGGLAQQITGQYKPFICLDLTHFDCGHDDYFHPDPPAGSYLATHWNIGSPNNLYIGFS